MAQQLSVNIPSVAVEDGAGGSVNLDADEETKSFVFTYLSRRAQNDKDLNRRDAEVIQNRGAEVVQTVAGTDSCDAATNVAHRLADIGELVEVYQTSLYGDQRNLFSRSISYSDRSKLHRWQFKFKLQWHRKGGWPPQYFRVGGYVPPIFMKLTTWNTT